MVKKGTENSIGWEEISSPVHIRIGRTENSIAWKEISSPVHYVLEVAVWVIVFAALGKTSRLSMVTFSKQNYECTHFASTYLHGKCNLMCVC